MFWSNRKKCPGKSLDRIWIEKKLDWLNTNFINISKQPTILPTKKYFKSNFQGEEKDAYLVLEVLSTYFQINPSRIKLEFYSERSHELGRGMITQRDGVGSSGLFYSDGYESSILIEEQQLRRPNSLIATIAHELSHYLIMDEKGYYFEEEENELLTDLTAIAYGFGIFLGNSKFKFQQWQSSDGWGGWSSSTQGYLPQQIIAYTMAEIESRRNCYDVDYV